MKTSFRFAALSLLVAVISVFALSHASGDDPSTNPGGGGGGGWFWFCDHSRPAVCMNRFPAPVMCGFVDVTEEPRDCIIVHDTTRHLYFCSSAWIPQTCNSGWSVPCRGQCEDQGNECQIMVEFSCEVVN